MSKRFTVTRTVEVKQAIVLKADTAAKAIEASRKTKFKDWSSETGKRTNYGATEFTAG